MAITTVTRVTALSRQLQLVFPSEYPLTRLPEVCQTTLATQVMITRTAEMVPLPDGQQPVEGQTRWNGWIISNVFLLWDLLFDCFTPCVSDFGFPVDVCEEWM